MSSSATLMSSAVIVTFSVFPAIAVEPLIVNFSIFNAEVEESAKLMLICLLVSALSKV